MCANCQIKNEQLCLKSFLTQEELFILIAVHACVRLEIVKTIITLHYKAIGVQPKNIYVNSHPLKIDPKTRVTHVLAEVISIMHLSQQHPLCR